MSDAAAAAATDASKNKDATSTSTSTVTADAAATANIAATGARMGLMPPDPAAATVMLAAALTPAPTTRSPPATSSTTAVAPPSSSTTATTGAPAPTAAALAALLATTLQDVEALREELVRTRTRAERAERLLDVFGEVRGLLDVAPSPPTDAAAGAVAPPLTNTSADNTNPPAASTPPTALPPALLTRLLALDTRATDAERARDDALSRLSAVSANWAQLSTYLGVVETRAADARAGFGRVVGGGGGAVVLADVPMPAASAAPYGPIEPLREGGWEPGRGRRDTAGVGFRAPPLPPLPQPHHQHEGKRARTESGDAYTHAHAHPSKKGRWDGYEHHAPQQHGAYRYGSTSSAAYASSAAGLPPPPLGVSSSRYDARRVPERQATIPANHHPSNSARGGADARGAGGGRTRSPSPAPSDDLDAILLESTNPSSRGRDEYPPHPHPQHGHPQHGHGHGHGDRAERSPEWGRGAAPERAGSLGAGAGYAVGRKGTKDSTGVFPYAAASTPAAVAVAAGQTQAVNTTPFPATNAAKQRICRQCGLPGRYKDGKCVEKWGPGPLGPGTVCDRCRKKMKRVERRGTLEQQMAPQQTAASGVAALHPGASGSGLRAPVQRTETLPASYRETPQESSIRSSLGAGTPRRQTSPANGDHASPPHSHPSSSAQHRTASSANVGRTIESRLTAPAGAPGLLPPLQAHGHMEIDGDEGDDLDLDADADGDAEVDEIEPDDADMAAAGASRFADTAADDVDGDGDADADLLEAVDAAEAASDAGSRRMQSED